MRAHSFAVHSTVPTEKCRFMNERVREISRFFVAPPHLFPVSVWAARNHTRTHKFPQLSTVIGAKMSHRKWRETKQQLIWWPDLALLGCSLVLSISSATSWRRSRYIQSLVRLSLVDQAIFGSIYATMHPRAHSRSCKSMHFESLTIVLEKPV